MDSVSEPIELLRDPGAWLPLGDLENFLDSMANEFQIGDPENFFRKIGQENSTLKAWGVLDSVLRMLETPHDIFAQPERLLSYFLSPHPNVQVKKLGKKEISFTFEFEVEPYPLVMAYLMGAMEGLPLYMGYPLAQLEFSNNEFNLNWDDGQEALFDDEVSRKRTFKPEIVESVLNGLLEESRPPTSSVASPGSSGLGASQSVNSEDLKRQIEEKIEDRLGDLFRKQDETRKHLGQVKNDFFKLYDYFTRAQQLITLISSSARKASVREAMRRVDWSLVQKQFPQIIEETCASLGTIEESVVMGPEKFRASKKSSKKIKKWNLNEAIEEVIENLDYAPGQIRIEKRWWTDSLISADLDKVQKALRDVLNLSVSRCQSGAELRVITRPNGRKVEIEITHTGQNLKIDELSKLMEADGLLTETKNILEGQKGRFDIHPGDSEGSTFLMQLPVTSSH